MTNSKTGLLKKIFVVVPKARGSSGQFHTVYKSIAQEFVRRGWEVVAADPSDVDFIVKLLRFGADPDAFIYFGHFYYNLKLWSQYSALPTSIGDMVQSTIAACLGDHPFVNFMWDRVANTHDRTIMFCLEPGYKEAAQLLRPNLSQFFTLPPPIVGEAPTNLVDFGDRPIDAIIPMNWYSDSNVQTLREKYAGKSQFSKVVDATYDTLICGNTEYPLTVYRNFLVEFCGIDLQHEIDTDLNHASMLLSALTDIDFAVRNERRREIISNLLSDVDGLNVHVVGNIPSELKERRGVVCYDSLPFDRLGEMYFQSRMIVHSHPTYPNGMHERFLYAAASGCVVISDDAPVLSQTFIPGEEWIPDVKGRTLRMVAEEYGPERLAGMADAARRRAWDNFSIADYAERMIAAFESL